MPFASAPSFLLSSSGFLRLLFNSDAPTTAPDLSDFCSSLKSFMSPVVSTVATVPSMSYLLFLEEFEESSLLTSRSAIIAAATGSNLLGRRWESIDRRGSWKFWSPAALKAPGDELATEVRATGTRTLAELNLELWYIGLLSRLSGFFLSIASSSSRFCTRVALERVLYVL